MCLVPRAQTKPEPGLNGPVWAGSAEVLSHLTVEEEWAPGTVSVSGSPLRLRVVAAFRFGGEHAQQRRRLIDLGA